MSKRTNRPNGSARERARLKQELADRRRRERKILIAAAVVLLLVVGGGIGVQYYRTHRAPSAGPGQESVDFAPVTVEPEKPLVLGAADAPVTLTVFSDFHCPHCVEFEELFGDTISAEQRSGRVALEVYSLSFIDQGSVTAANAMACAADAGFGQAYYEGLWQNASRAWSPEQLTELARQLDVDAGDDFDTCVTGMGQQAWVKSMDAAAEAKGVEGTPTVFLQDELLPLDGLTPEALQDRIDAAASA